MLYDLQTGDALRVPPLTQAFIATAEPYAVTEAQALQMLGGTPPGKHTLVEITEAARKHANTDLFHRGPSGRVFVRVGREFHAVGLGKGNGRHDVGTPSRPGAKAVNDGGPHSKAQPGARQAYGMGREWGKKMADVAEVRIGACADEAADAIRAGDKRMMAVDWHPLRKVPREFVADYRRGFDEAVRDGAQAIVDGQKMLYRHASIPLCGVVGASKPRAKKVAAKAKRKANAAAKVRWRVMQGGYGLATGFATSITKAREAASNEARKKAVREAGRKQARSALWEEGFHLEVNGLTRYPLAKRSEHLRRTWS